MAEICEKLSPKLSQKEPDILTNEPDHKKHPEHEHKKPSNELAEPKRKVSIASNAIQADIERNRKISAASLEAKRNMLMNGGEFNLSPPCNHHHHHNHYRASCGKWTFSSEIDRC